LANPFPRRPCRVRGLRLLLVGGGSKELSMDARDCPGRSMKSRTAGAPVRARGARSGWARHARLCRRPKPRFGANGSCRRTQVHSINVSNILVDLPPLGTQGTAWGAGRQRFRRHRRMLLGRVPVGASAMGARVPGRAVLLPNAIPRPEPEVDTFLLSLQSRTC
jgi:hypothetical protein